MSPATATITPSEAAALHHALRDRLPMWTVTRRPRDFPDAWVARLHLALPRPEPTAALLLAPTLAELRELLPPGLACLTRDPSDDPVIMESWL